MATKPKRSEAAEHMERMALEGVPPDNGAIDRNAEYIVTCGRIGAGCLSHREPGANVADGVCPSCKEPFTRRSVMDGKGYHMWAKSGM